MVLSSQQGDAMPLILRLLGVPLGMVLILMRFGVI
jgi:hypothetical protein